MVQLLPRHELPDVTSTIVLEPVGSNLDTAKWSGVVRFTVAQKMSRASAQRTVLAYPGLDVTSTPAVVGVLYLDRYISLTVAIGTHFSLSARHVQFLWMGEAITQQILAPDVCENLRDRSCVMNSVMGWILGLNHRRLSVDTGLRPEECYRILWDSITWVNGRDGTLLVTHGKTKPARRMLPMTPRVRHILEARWEAAGKPTEGFV